MSSQNTSKQSDTTLIIEPLRSLAVDVREIHMDPSNARMGHDVEGIAESIKRYGQRTPIVVNKSEGNVILKGNGTYQAMVEILHAGRIAAVFVEDAELTAHGYALADNRLTDLSFFDPEAVVKVLLDAEEDVLGMATLHEMLKEIADYEPDEPEPVEEGDFLEQKKVILVFELDVAIYERYTRLHTSLGASKTDEEIFELLLNNQQ